MPPLFSRKYTARREELLKIIRSDLERVQRYSHKDGHEFICADDAKEIWTLPKIQALARGLPWDKPPLLERAHEDFKLVLSVLAWIHWDGWSDFGRAFLEHLDGGSGEFDRADRYLPFSPTTVVLADHARNGDFLKRQYIFIPIELAEEGQHQHAQNKDEYEDSYRLPFLETRKIGEGAAGDVFSALVASKYFIYEQGHLNAKGIWVAIKRIQRSDHIKTKTFMAEQNALRTFKQCLRKHENIMHSYMSFIHGSDFVIISPLADLDLAAFFKGNYEGFNHRQREFSPYDLFQEAACLAGALNFLHNGLELRGRKIACAHLDFKPDNILVRWTATSQSTSVGQWLIHDFGTSRIKESSEEPNALAPGDFLTRFSLTKAQRTPSTYQAPEVQDNTERTTGRESDMWSFGCILCVALAFALGGPRFVTDLGNATFDGRNDWFYTKVDGVAVVKVAISEWLNSRTAGRQEDTWISRIIELAFKMLVITPAGRMKAEEAQDELNIICSQESERMTRKCRWPRPPSPAADTLSSVRHRDRQDPGLHPVDASGYQPNSITATPPSRRMDYSPNLNPATSPRQAPASYSLQPAYSTPFTATTYQYGMPSSPTYGQTPMWPPIPSPSIVHQLNGFGPGPASPWNPSFVSSGFNSANNQSFATSPRQPSIIRTDTITRDSIYTPPSLPLKSPSKSSHSDENSSMDKGSQRSSSSVDLTFGHLASPQGSSKSVVCGSSTRVAFMSRSSVLVHNFECHNNWTAKKPPKNPDNATFGFYAPNHIQCPTGFEWDLISLYKDWLVLRAKNGADCRFLRYQCYRRYLDDQKVAFELWKDTSFETNQYGVSASDAVNGIARGVLETKVNGRGDVIFVLDAGLCLYSAAMGLHRLEIEGQLRRSCFSSDGNYVFAWTMTHSIHGYQNRWYIWDVNSTTAPVMDSTSEWVAVKIPFLHTHGLN
ncbi:uncharacterized protein PAC_05856 [Phialocephala subalpina]|uniref:Protein kinase domain-containing protein n=1 Tax=Phialocephala subalpina TaxID=576137 RepID=A0A1L7WT56_9HELO|nr:uncharacterized protein PAC_05856 [Phialocephala subalpina]